jgi:hypothetical protein
MTNKGPRRAATDGEWSGRLTQAREFHESARSLVTLAGSKSYNGAITLMITAAIGYADAITAKLNGVVNKQDHQAASRLLRDVLGNSLPDKHEKYFRRLLGRKDEVNYGARSTTHDEAERLIAELDEFAAWAEGVL